MEGNRSSKKGPRPSTLISILSVGWTKSMVEMKTLDVCGNIPPLLASHTPPSYPLLASALFLPWLLLSLRRRRLYDPSSGAHDLPRRRRSRRPPSPAPMRPPAGGPLPGGCACADLRSHLVAAPARRPSGAPCEAPLRRPLRSPSTVLQAKVQVHPCGWLLSCLPRPWQTTRTPRP
jgi:hypothetical protein